MAVFSFKKGKPYKFKRTGRKTKLGKTISKAVKKAKALAFKKKVNQVIAKDKKYFQKIGSYTAVYPPASATDNNVAALTISNLGYMTGVNY